MKKGLLTVLAASLVFVGCQNYDDQFDDLNAQISALKSQVDGLSSLSGQVASLSGTISGLQAGIAQAASSSSLSALSSSLSALQADVDAVQASLAGTATASAVATLQAEIDAIEADVDELLATSNVYNQNLTISSASTLDAAVALGNNINIVNGSVTITQSSAMDATKLQSVIDKVFTVTGNFSYTAANTNVTAMTFNKLASTGDLTLKVNGPIHANALVTAGTITLDDSYISKVTAIHMDALTTVTEIQTDSGGTDNIVFTSATDVQLGALASYPGAGSDYGLTITTKADATLDIGSLDDVKTDGTAAPVALTLNGPKDVTISNMTAYAGSLSLTNVENATVTGFKGPITVNGGVENITMTDVEDFAFSSATALKTVTLDVDKASDPALTATQKAPSAYGAAVTSYTAATPALTFSGMANLTSVTLTGFYQSLTFTSLANLTTVDIDATTGGLTMSGNNSMTSLDVTGSEIGNVSITSNTAIASLELDHTTDLNFYGTTADRTYVTLTVTGNSELTSLTNSADKIRTLNVQNNDKLTTINFTGLATPGTSSTVDPTVDVYDNDLTASQASDTSDGLSQYSIDGTNDASDLGSYTTTSGMGTLKTYLTAVAADADNDSAVHFDTVSLHNIASDAGATGETVGDQNSGNAVTFTSEANNDVTLVYYNRKNTLVTTTGLTGYVPATEEQRAWLIDTSVTGSTATITLQVTPAGGVATHILAAGSTFGTYTFNGNPALDVANLTSSTITSRATTLGTTINAYLGGNSTLPAIAFSGDSSITSGANGEAFTDNELAAIGDADGHVISNVTSYDQFTMTIGGRSVTITPTLISGATSLYYTEAATTVAANLIAAWNYRWGTGASVPAGQSANTSNSSLTLVYWGNLAATTAGTIDAETLQSSNSGSRAYGQTVAISHTRPSSSTVSYATSGAATFTFMDWTIGATQATTDNGATSSDIILTLASTNGLSLTNYATLIQGTDLQPIDAGEWTASGILGLTTAKDLTAGTNTQTTTNDIFQDDAGQYGSIAGGLTGDVVKAETANEGVSSSSSSGSARLTYTRLHWLG